MILSLRAVARLAAVAAAVGVVHTACADRTPKVEVTTALITRGPIVHRVVAAGMRFLGPSGATMRQLGDKIAAREIARSVGVPVLSGSAKPIHKPEDAYRQAERDGYHAVVPLGTLDLGVDGGKSAVDIPVVGPCEASLHVASLLGERFGLITYRHSGIPLIRSLVRHYGMDPWVAGFRAVGFNLSDLAAHHDEVVENFVAEARSLIENDGADVIIPMGISQCPVHIKPDWLSQELGVPVVEGIGAPIRVAAMLAGLGLKVSRVRWRKCPIESPK